MLRKLTKSKSSKNITDLIPVFKGFNWIQEFVMMGLVPFQKEWHDAAQTLCVCVKSQAQGLLQIHSFHPPIFSVAYSILCHRRCWSLSQLTLDERVHQTITAPTLSLVDSLIVFLLWPLLYLYCTRTLSCNTVLVLRWMFLFYTSINFQIQGRIIKDGLKMHFISSPCALSLHSVFPSNTHRIHMHTQ